LGRDIDRAHASSGEEALDPVVPTDERADMELKPCHDDPALPRNPRKTRARDVQEDRGQRVEGVKL